MTEIARLTALITADVSGFNKGMTSASQTLDRFGALSQSVGKGAAESFSLVEKGASSLGSSLAGMTKEAFDASGVLGELLRGIKGTGSAAEAAAQKTLGAAGAVKEMGTSAAAAVASLDLLGDAATLTSGTFSVLGEGAGAAGKSVSGLGRAAASTAPRVEALSKVGFDPARIVAGVDAGVAAFGRLKAAAASIPAAMRSASSAAPVFMGGGERGALGAAEEGERRAGTFGGGVKAGAGAALDLAGAGAMITTILAGVTGMLSVKFDNLLQGVKGNTTMSDADASAMRQLTLQLMKTGTPDEQIAKAYMHVQNFAYKGQDAARIVEEGNRMGIATHSPVEETGRILAATLREYNLPAIMSRQMAETLHLTSASGDMYLKEFDKYAGKAFATGAADKVSAPEIAAALSAITQHGIAIPKASTQVTGMLKQIVNPTKKGKDEADALGIGGDFTPEGLLKKQLSGVMKDVMRVTGGNAGQIGTLFNGMQGGLGAKILTGMGAGTYDTALNDPKTGTKAAFAGKTNAIDPLYNQQMKQTQQAFAALSGEIKADFIPIGQKIGPLFTAAIPVIRETANILKTLLDGFTKLPQPAQEAIIAIGGLKIISGFLPMLGGFGLLTEKTTALLGGFGKMLLGIAPEAAEGGAALSGPFLLGIGAVALAVAGLTLAWTTDFGHIREVASKVGSEVMGFVSSQFGFVAKWFQTNMPLIRQTVSTVLTTVQQLWASHGQRVMAIVGPLWDFLKTTVSAALHIILDVVKLGMDVLTGHWAAAGKDIGGIVTNLWAVVRSLFVNGGKAIGNTLMLVVDLVLDFGKRLFEGMLNAGQQAINGIVGGIKSGLGKVAAVATELGHSITGAVNTALDSHSPSRKMHEAGLWATQGLANGLRDGTITAAQAADYLGDTVHRHVKAKLTESQKEMHAYIVQMGQEQVTLAALRAGKDMTVAGTLGKFHEVPGAAALASIKDQIAQIKIAETQQRAFNLELAKTKAQIADIMAGGNKRQVQAAHRFSGIPQAQRDGLGEMKAILDGLKKAGSGGMDDSNAFGALAKGIAKEAVAAIVPVKALAKVVQDFNAEMAAKVSGAKEVIAGGTDPTLKAWQDYLANHGALAAAIGGDAALAAAEFGKFKLALDTDQQAAGLTRMRDLLSDIARQSAEINAKSAFGAFKAGQMASDGMGGIKLPPGMTDAELHKIFDAQKVLDQAGKAKDAVAQMVQSMGDIVNSSLTGLFQNGFKGFFANVVGGFEKMFADIGQQYLQNKLMNMILGAVGGSAMQSQYGSGGSTLGNLFGGARATGGPITAGLPYLVGEKGPELIMPSSSGTVIPNHQLALAGAGGGDTHNYNISVTVPSSGGNREMDRRSGQQVAQAAIEEMQRTQRRNGR